MIIEGIAIVTNGLTLTLDTNSTLPRTEGFSTCFDNFDNSIPVDINKTRPITTQRVYYTNWGNYCCSIIDKIFDKIKRKHSITNRESQPLY